MSKLVGNGGKDTGLGLCFLELLWAEKVGTQDSVVGISSLLESFGYGVRNGGLAEASLTSQPEDMRAGQWVIVNPFGDVFLYLDTHSDCAHFMLQALLFENSFVVSLLRGTQTFQGQFLFNKSALVKSLKT